MRLAIDSLEVTRRGRICCEVADLEFGVGSHVLAGANGSGKSSLLAALAGLLPWSGHVRLDGRALAPRRVAERIGFLPQDPCGLDHLTVAAAVRYAHYVLAGSLTGWSEHALLEEVGIGGLGPRRVSRLSGGQRQMAYLAMALAHDPAVLLLDEPTAGLDAGHRTLFREAIGRLGQRLVVITASHGADDIYGLGDHVVVLRRGRVAFDGTAPQLTDRVGPGQHQLHALDQALIALEEGA